MTGSSSCSYLCQLLPVNGMLRPWVGVQHHDQPPVAAGVLGDLDHARHVARLVVQDVEENLAGHLRLMLQLDHLRAPVCLLWVVERDVLPLEVRDGLVLSPGRWIARTT